MFEMQEFATSLRNLVVSRNKVPLMIISLGSILLRTEPGSNDTRDVAAMHVAGATSEDILRVGIELVFVYGKKNSRFGMILPLFFCRK